MDESFGINSTALDKTCVGNHTRIVSLGNGMNFLKNIGLKASSIFYIFSLLAETSKKRDYTREDCLECFQM